MASTSKLLLPTHVDATWLTTFRRKIKSWYSRNHRDLPWRRTRDAYAIWVSEIMLQQTQVATVLDYYQRFLKRFPTVDKLAAADEQAVLAMWSGLGYYRRAKQLHKAAQKICADHGGVFPTDFEDVLALPGVGRYTAGAITSFAYEQARPVLEANTLRLHCRLLGMKGDITAAHNQNQLWELADRILPKTGARTSSSPGDAPASNSISSVNQAVMELGSLICTPSAPKCDQCPLSSLCAAYEKGIQTEIPEKKAKQKFEVQTHVMLLIADGQKWLMRQNPQQQWWAGLWDFPRLRIHSKLTEQQAKRLTPNSKLATILEEEIQSELDIDCSLVEYLKTMKHGVTKYRITLFCLQASMHIADSKQVPKGWMWVSIDQAAKLPLTSTSQRVLTELNRI